jgi:hypothetical protein
VHHALRARFCIERERYWHAEYWISATRDYALALACHRRGLPTSYGRGFDDLPVDVLEKFKNTFAKSLDKNELRRTLTRVVEGLLSETEEAQDLTDKIELQLRELIK